jgi:hypothetical protein
VDLVGLIPQLRSISFLTPFGDLDLWTTCR